MIFKDQHLGTLSNVNSAMSGGGPKLILSQTASSDASIEFTANIDNTYDKYMFVFVDLEISYNGSQIVFDGSTNGGSSYGITKTSSVFLRFHLTVMALILHISLLKALYGSMMVITPYL